MVEGVRLDGGGGEVGMDLWLEMLEWAISTDSLIFPTKRHMERQTHAWRFQYTPSPTSCVTGGGGGGGGKWVGGKTILRFSG